MMAVLLGRTFTWIFVRIAPFSFKGVPAISRLHGSCFFALASWATELACVASGGKVTECRWLLVLTNSRVELVLGTLLVMLRSTSVQVGGLHRGRGCITVAWLGVCCSFLVWRRSILNDSFNPLHALSQICKLIHSSSQSSYLWLNKCNLMI
jgi:hypothetical protein